MRILAIPALFGVLLVSLLGLTGCQVASIHPIYGPGDPPLLEPGVEGLWKAADGPATYEVTRQGHGYHLLMKTNDPKDPATFEFAVRLVQLGDRTFADFSATARARSEVGEKHGLLFAPTHLFSRWTLDGDRLESSGLHHDWLKRALADGKVTLAHTAMDEHSTLLTAETAALQKFLRDFGGDDAAFADTVRLVRAAKTP